MFEGRIAQFNGPGQPFEIREVALTDVAPGEILVRIHRANICGSDLHAWHGDFALSGLGGHMPTVLGHEMVGSVVALGDGVTEDANGAALAVGSRIVFPYFQHCNLCRSCIAGRRVACKRLRMAMLGDSCSPPYFVGGFGDYYLLPAGGVPFCVPDALSDDVVAGANCALSQVLFGFERVGLRFGETVVIQGAGGLGLYATAVARAHGAARVVVIDAVKERLELAQAFGADDVIDVTATTDSAKRVRRVRGATGGNGADVVVELVGDPSVVPEGIKMLAQGGRYLEIGNINLGRTYVADPSRLVMANKSVVGVSLYEPSVLGRSLAFLEREAGRVPLDRLASTTFDLNDIDAAFVAAERREVARASIVMS